VASAASSSVGRSSSVAFSTNGVRKVMYRDIVDGCGSSGVTLCGEFRVVRGLVSGLPVSVRV
jgi:hypothetical protein